jgi:N-acetylglucosaminyldiphosphoundecaprenol N-acetyl-beta-D-mannosaminyltransferase
VPYRLDWEALQYKRRSKVSIVSTISVAAVPFRVATPTSAADDVVSLALTGDAQPVRLANAYCLAVASKSKDYFEVISGAGHNYPDGFPVVVFMRLFNKSRRPERVRGPSLFRDVLAKSQGTSVQHLFIGSTSSTLDQMVARIECEYPGATIAGAYSPPFAPVTDEYIEDIAAFARRRDCNLVWVGLGTPKQDLVAAKLAQVLNVPCVGVGAAFDFVAGTVPEAPLLVQRLGLEWVYRLVSEPRRLWRRYTIGNIQFLYAVARAVRIR